MPPKKTKATKTDWEFGVMKEKPSGKTYEVALRETPVAVATLVHRRPQITGAKRFAVVDGHLWIIGQDGAELAAFAAGTWVSVREVKP